MSNEIVFNSIYIIQSLKNNEPQTGTILHEDIIRRRIQQYHKHLDSYLINVDTKKAFFATLNQLNSDFFHQGVIPYLHFEIHGSKKGLTLKSNELIVWEELSPALAQINFNIKNNLFVSLSTCYGAYIFNAIQPVGRIPFRAYIAPTSEITIGEIEADWNIFFDELLVTRSFTIAIAALNKTNTRTPYMFSTGEYIFDRAMKKWLSSYGNRQLKRKKMLKQIKNAKGNAEIKNKFSNNEIKDFYKQAVTNMPANIQHIKDYFLMKTDIPFF